MAALSEWLQIMLAEIARKRDDLERAHEEDVQAHYRKTFRHCGMRTNAASSTRVDGAAQRCAAHLTRTAQRTTLILTTS